MGHLVQNILIMFSLMLSWGVSSAELEKSGKAIFEFRQYQNDNNTASLDQNIGGGLQFNSSYGGGQLGLFLQGDIKDENRNLLLVEEGNYSFFLDEEENTKVLLGYTIYNWSIMEAFHLVNNINSISYVSHTENLKKKGELVFELEKTFDSGSLALYFFPKFERPILPGKKSRLGLEVDFASPVIVQNREIEEESRPIPQFGARATWEGAVSFSLYALYHIDRHAPLYGTHKYRAINPIDYMDAPRPDLDIDIDGIIIDPPP